MGLVFNVIVSYAESPNPSGNRELIMIKTQIIKENRRPVAVILDYKEYMRLKEIEEDKTEYDSALETKKKNKKWTSHKDLKKALGV